MHSWILDIEVFENLFFVGVYDYKEKKSFTLEVSSRKDERLSFYDIFSKYDGYLITFNGIHYDTVVMKYILKEFHKLRTLNVDDFCKNIHQFSYKAINSDTYFDEIKWYKWYKGTMWTDIDLFCYWSKMLRISKKISLKSLAIQIGFDEIQELPYDPSARLNADEIEEVIRYNTRNDIGILTKLFEKMKEDIVIRKYIKDEYGLACWSMDAPKIAGELLINDYCEKIYPHKHKNLIPSDHEYFEGYKTLKEFTKDFKNKRFPPFTGKVKEIMGDFKVSFEIPQFQKLFDKMMESGRDFAEEFPLIYDDTRVKMSYGIGGAHSIQKNEIYESTDVQTVMTADYGSLYPNIIINWKCIRFIETLIKYAEVKAERFVAKRSKDKKKDSVLKLILNALSGLLDNEHSPLYYPEGALRMRIIGQLILTKTVELLLLNGYRVISVNTDGIEYIVPKGKEEHSKDILKEAEKLFNIPLEYEVYEKIVYSNVNNYIAKTVSGKIKRKGLFKYHDDIPLGDSVNEQVIAIALEKYFIDRISIDETIRNPDKYGLHIYDYCVSKKISKSTYDVFYFNEEQQQMEQVQNLNRYYFSKRAPLLFKSRKNSDKLEHIHKGQGVKLFNKFKELKWEDYDIDYSYYTAKTRELINDLEKDVRQASLF